MTAGNGQKVRKQDAPLFYGEQAQVVKPGNCRKTAGEGIDTLRDISDVDGNGDAGLVVDRRTLSDGQDACPALRDAGQQSIEYTGRVVEHHGENGLSRAAEIRRFKDVVLVLIVSAAGNAHLLDRLADLLELAALHQSAAGEDLLIIFRQNAFMNDQIV